MIKVGEAIFKLKFHTFYTIDFIYIYRFRETFINFDNLLSNYIRFFLMLCIDYRS